MKVFRLVVLSVALLCLYRAVSVADTGPKPKFGPQATRLFHAHDYFRSHAAPDFWALMPYYVPQKDGGACAVAANSMVLNALRAKQSLRSDEKLATQAEIYSKVDYWKLGTEPEIGGISLIGMEKVLDLTLKAYGMRDYTIERVQVKDDSKETRKMVRKALAQNEKSDSDFIIPLYFQQDFTGDPEGQAGHFAPVAAFDERQGKVLLFDPDREWYEPYWVSEETFVKGMANPKADSIRPGGYIWVKTKK